MQKHKSEIVPILKAKIDRKSFIERWVKNLESGKYKQTEGDLRDDDGFCCLGVACETANDVVKKNFWLYNEFDDFNGAKLSPEMGKFMFGKNHSNIQRSLIHMNDVKKKSFKEIAKFIRKEILDLNGKWYVKD